MNQHKNDEIDLIYFFSKLKNTLRGWVKLFFNIIDHITRNWKIISVLIVLGIILGYFAQQNYKPAQKATALIRVNFDAVDYVYSEIDLLNEKVKENDSIFFTNIGLKGDSLEINEIEIKPQINLNEIIAEYEINDRKLEGLLRNLEFDDNDIKVHETFTSEYQYHKLEFSLSNSANNETVNKVIGYINSNEILEELKVQVVKDFKDQLANNKKSIDQINNVIDAYQTNESLVSPSDQIFVVDKNFSIHLLFERKIELQKLNQGLQRLLVLAKDIVVIVNKPNIIEENEGLSGNKIIYYPMLFVFLFLFFSFLRHTYFYLRGVAISES